MAGRARRRGFTLIELLVAISLMALMAVLSWRGLDGVSRSQQQLQRQADDVLVLQTTLAQWGVDLDAIVEQPDFPALDWDGRVLRILRRGDATPGDGLRVVAWARRAEAGQAFWWRWQSPPLLRRNELEQAWQKAQLWAQNPGDDDRLREVRTVALDQWQIFYYRGNAWSNPLSSAGASDDAAAPAQSGTPVPPGQRQTQLPDGVRLVLTLSTGQGLSGALTRDWVRGQVGGGK